MYTKRGESTQDIEMDPPHSSIVEENCSLCFSDANDETLISSSGSYYYEQHSSCAPTHNLSEHFELCRNCFTSNSSMEIDLEGVISDVEENVQKFEKDCRICHLNLEIYGQESGGLFILGCSCKDDLASAHKQCAETWFKIKGNKKCEICGSIAKNVVGNSEAESIEHTNESTGSTESAPPPPPTTMPQAETTRLFWQGHNFLNFLLACMIFIFVISWFFHFNLPS